MFTTELLWFERGIKEAIYIRVLKPYLNRDGEIWSHSEKNKVNRPNDTWESGEGNTGIAEVGVGAGTDCELKVVLSSTVHIAICWLIQLKKSGESIQKLLKTSDILFRWIKWEKQYIQ